MSNTETIIKTVSKNSREEIRIALDTFKGMDLLDVRVFASFDDSEERKATKKGISVRVERIPELIEAFALAEAEARRRGLLKGGSQ